MKVLWGTRPRATTAPTRSLADWTPQMHLDGMRAACKAFQKAYPAYATTRKLDDLRTTDYARLDRLGHVYLDYTGGGVYAQSQVARHMALLNNSVFGNPHSHNLTSMAMTRLVEQARTSVLTCFGGSPEEYVVIFTPN